MWTSSSTNLLKFLKQIVTNSRTMMKSKTNTVTVKPVSSSPFSRYDILTSWSFNCECFCYIVLHYGQQVWRQYDHPSISYGTVCHAMWGQVTNLTMAAQVTVAVDKLHNKFKCSKSLHSWVINPNIWAAIIPSTGWLHGTAVERRSLSGELSLSCAWPTADGWPLMWG